MFERIGRLVPRYVDEGYAVLDKDGSWGTPEAGIKPDAPQWAQDEYERFRKQQETMRIKPEELK